MLLSFSEPAMLPYIRAGIRQAHGEDVGNERVKRQTIRRLGPRAEQLLSWDMIGGSTPYRLQLYWKSRTPEGAFLGEVSSFRVYRINILHSSVVPPDAPEYECIRIDGRAGWRDGDSMLFWSPGDAPNGFCEEAHKDGFDSPEAFRDYFVPNKRDRFAAVLFKW